ncbi:MAG: DnaJ domain-containing protein [Rhodospirillaceae bacterium]|nr:DnaJ domain-containing protein [Rhodospirillaceae bacterium]
MTLAYFFIGVLLLVLLLFGLRAFVRADPKKLVFSVKVLAVGFGVVGLVWLAAGGRLGIVMMLAAMALPIFARMRARRRAANAGTFGGPPREGQASSLDTRFFSVTLDHDSGALDGSVREGAYRGRMLSDLDLPALLSLLAECRDDPASAQVLAAYLDREYGPEWRDQAGADGDAGTEGTGGGSSMTREEAYRILGLEPGADEAAIKAAHHRLMLKFHPDQGGSAWFAARINEARDLLTGR